MVGLLTTLWPAPPAYAVCAKMNVEAVKSTNNHRGVKSNVWTPANLSLNCARPITNGERHSIGDIGYAHFTGLRFENGSGWHPWTNTQNFFNSDPDYRNFINSDTDVEVKLG